MGLGVSIQRNRAPFDSSVVKVILESFGAFQIFKNLVSRNWLVVEGNGVKMRPRGRALSVYRVLLTVRCSRSFCGHSLHF